MLGEIFSWRKIPSVLGELVAGMILRTLCFRFLLVVNGVHLIQINEIVLAFGEIGGILILFAAGLEMTFQDFRKVGTAGFVIGTLGVVVPFIMGYGLSASIRIWHHCGFSGWRCSCSNKHFDHFAGTNGT